MARAPKRFPEPKTQLTLMSNYVFVEKIDNKVEVFWNSRYLFSALEPEFAYGRSLYGHAGSAYSAGGSCMATLLWWHVVCLHLDNAEVFSLSQKYISQDTEFLLCCHCLSFLSALPEDLLHCESSIS